MPIFAPERRRSLLLVAGAVVIGAIGVALLAAGLAGWVRWLEGGGTLLGALIVAVLGVGAATWLIPRRQIARLRAAGVDDEVKLAEIGNASRSTITQAAGGVGLILTLALTAYQVNETRRSSDENLRVTEQGQVTERFSRAVEQLGATAANGEPALDIRIGGLFSLLRIGLDSERDTLPALLVASQYVVNNQQPPRAAPARGEPCVTPRPEPRADINAALRYVLPQLTDAIRKRPGFRRGYASGLEGADFSRTSLAEVRFGHHFLAGVSFRGADLERATFNEVLMERVDMRGACLANANLTTVATTSDPNSQRGQVVVDLRGADIRGARVSAVVADVATVDRTTIGRLIVARGDEPAEE